MIVAPDKSVVTIFSFGGRSVPTTNSGVDVFNHSPLLRW